jgi:hypothetical protein
MHAKHGKLFRKKAKKKSFYPPPHSSSLEILHHAFWMQYLLDFASDASVLARQTIQESKFFLPDSEMGFEASSLSRNEESWIWFKGLVFRLEEKFSVCSREREREMGFEAKP